MKRSPHTPAIPAAEAAQSRPTASQPDWWPTRKLVVIVVGWLISVGVELPPGAPELIADHVDLLGDLVGFAAIAAAWFVPNQAA